MEQNESFDNDRVQEISAVKHLLNHAETLSDSDLQRIFELIMEKFPNIEIPKNIK